MGIIRPCTYILLRSGMFLSLRGMMSMTERRVSCPVGFVASIMAMSYKKRVKDTTVSYGPGDVHCHPSWEKTRMLVYRCHTFS